MPETPHSDEPLISLSTSENFDRFAARWGGVSKATQHEFNSSKMYSDHKLVLAIATQLLREKRQNSLGETLQCDFGFVDAGTLDAFAEFLYEQHAFGLHAGLVMLAYYLAGELFIVRDHRDGFRLTHPHPDLRESGTNVSLIPSEEQLYDLASHSAHMSQTVSKKRLVIAQYFREFFLLFALFHEFHHVIWGHCKFANASIGARRLHEVGPIVSSKKDNELLHNLEYMADVGAIDLMIWYVNRRSKLNIKWISRISYADLHRLALVASGIMCAAWHAHDCQQGRDGSHPLPSARFANLVAHYACSVKCART
jgi:hypothetical protein